MTLTNRIRPIVIFGKLILISLPSLIILCITFTMSCISLTWKSFSVSGGSPKSNFQLSRRNLFDKIDFDIVMLTHIILYYLSTFSRSLLKWYCQVRGLIRPLRCTLTQIYQKRETYETFIELYIFFSYHQYIDVNNIQDINAK